MINFNNMKTKFNKTEKQKLSKTFSIVAIASILIGSLVAANMQPAYAVIVIDTYDDKTAFTDATGATSIGPIPNEGISLPHQSTKTIGSVDFSTVHSLQSLIFGDGPQPLPNDDWTVLTAGQDIAISDNEDLDIDLAAPVYSLGFEFVEPSCTIQDGGNLCANGDRGSNVSTVTTIDSVIVHPFSPVTFKVYVPPSDI